MAKVGKVNVIKLDPVSFGTLASSILFLVFPVVGDITSGVARLTEALADPGGFLASLQRIGAPDAVISNVAKCLTGLLVHLRHRHPSTTLHAASTQSATQ